MSKPTREKLEALRKAKRERLPDWLRDVSDYVEHRIFNQEEDGKDGAMWREHGCDMLTKINQLMDEIERLRKESHDGQARNQDGAQHQIRQGGSTAGA